MKNFQVIALSFKEQSLCMTHEESEDNEVQENDEGIDIEIERIYKHPLKNRKLKIFTKHGTLNYLVQQNS